MGNSLYEYTQIRYLRIVIKKKDTKELEKAQEQYYDSIPEKEKNPNHKEDFEKVLSLAVSKKITPTKKKMKD